ncbi:MAG TPA: tetratricopeptide repeat protein [Bacteroidota bacterium]
MSPGAQAKPGQPGGTQRQPDDRRMAASLTRVSFVLFALFLLLYAVASLYPDSFLWGVHQLAFIEAGVRLALLLIAVALALPWISSLYVPRLESLLRPDTVRTVVLVPVLLAAGAAAALACFQFRISTDMYGDSRTLLTLLANRQFTPADLFKLDLTSNELQEPLTRLIHQSIAQIFGLDQRFVFQIVSSVAGGLFLILVSYTALTAKGPSNWKLLFLVAFLTCGANQLFFGHVEDYTLVYLGIVLFLILAWKFFDGRKSLPLCVIVFLIGTRLHTGMVLLLPALLYLVFYSKSQKDPRFRKWIQPRTVLAAVGLTLVAGTLAYFFWFKANRMIVGDRVERGEKIFLPMSNVYLPPHNYTLLTPSHFSDIVQEFLLTVSPGAVVVLLLGIVFFRQIKWNTPRMIFFGLAAFYFMLFNSTVNPLLTPERDWDLLSLAAAPVCFFAIALTKDLFDRLKDSSFSRSVVGISLALGLLSCSMFYVNSDPMKAGERLRSLGVWAFGSYYLGSAYLLNVGAKYEPDRASEIRDRMDVLKKLEPLKSTPDMELGFLSHKLADVLYLDGRFTEAAEYYTKSLGEDPYNASAIKALAGVSLHTGNLDGAVDFMTYYNENINPGKVIDLDGLMIAEKINYLRYLLYTRADSALIVGTLEEINLGPRE